MKYLAVKYVQEVTDRYGRKHLYFRRAGFPRVKLEGLPGSRAFADSYEAALKSAPEPRVTSAGRIIPKTFADLFDQYYRSSDFTGLQSKTQKNYRDILSRLDALRDIHVAAITRADVLKIRDSKDAISLMRRLKTILNFAVEREFRGDNPADKVKIKGRRRPFRAWTDKDIKTFLERYKPESRQTLAITLLLYTGARRQDIVTFGWHNINGSVLVFTPQKTSYTDDEPKQLIIPIHPVLMARIKDLPKDDPAFLMSEYNSKRGGKVIRKPMSEAGFSNWFSQSARDAGLPHNSSPHGLRKAASRHLAEAGATTHEIASVTGHASLKEVERYTASASQAKLARSAMRLLDGGKTD